MGGDDGRRFVDGGVAPHVSVRDKFQKFVEDQSSSRVEFTGIVPALSKTRIENQPTCRVSVN